VTEDLRSKIHSESQENFCRLVDGHRALTAEIGGAQPLPAKCKTCEACPRMFCNFYHFVPRPPHLQVIPHYDGT
jgi:hypothetical protein